MTNFCVQVYVLTLILSAVNSANIIAITISPFYSHQAIFRPLWRELAKKGHNLTLVATDIMEPNENITQIDQSGIYKILEENGMPFFTDKHEEISFSLNGIRKFLHVGDSMMRYHLAHPEVQSLIKSDYQCDLIITELYFPWFLALGKKFNCPVIAIISMDAPPFFHNLMGNAINPAIYSYVDLAYGDKLTFAERLKNIMWTGLQFLVFHSMSPIVDSYVNEYIGPDLPKVHQLRKSLSLLIIKANPIFFPVRPSTPLTVNVGANFHLEEPKPLPEDLQVFLDESKNGCIYLSFGSKISSNHLPLEATDVFRKVFEGLSPVRILWKYQNDTLANKPKNLEIRKWLPQQDVLRHPNVKVFITHGGLQSMEEAIDRAVPMLGMPFFGDQFNNVNKMVQKQFGLKLTMDDLNEESLRNALMELMNNTIYKKNIEKLSAISRDQPMTGLQKAVWWTEYVIRHRTTEHLRSPSADIPLYQYFFIDIILFVTTLSICLFVIIYYLYRFLRILIRKLFDKKTKEKVN